jgi:hypothetical protein
MNWLALSNYAVIAVGFNQRIKNDHSLNGCESDIENLLKKCFTDPNKMPYLQTDK